MFSGRFHWHVASALVLCTTLGMPAHAQDEYAARMLAKQNNCFRCHAIDREKNAPAWSAIAVKYRSKPDAEERLLKHLTSAPKVKLLEDGIEEDHKIAKYSDRAELVNMVRWVLSLQR